MPACIAFPTDNGVGCQAKTPLTQSQKQHAQITKPRVTKENTKRTGPTRPFIIEITSKALKKSACGDTRVKNKKKTLIEKEDHT